MHGLRRSIASFGSSWKGSRGLVVVRQSTDEYTRQRFDAKPVDFSVVTSMRSLEKYMKFHTMSWETDLKPAFSLPEEISQKMIASAKEARPCEVIPVTFAVSVLRACEASVCMEELMDVTSIRGPEEKLVTNPHSPLVQLDILHDTETEGSLETFPHESNHILSTNSSSAMKFRFDEMVKSLYIPRGEFHLSLNFPIRGSGFRGTADIAFVLEHEGQYHYSPLHEMLHSIKYVVGCAPTGLKSSLGNENEGGHYKLIAQMAAAIGHNQGGSLWGALTDGKDVFRFYRMTRTDNRPPSEIPCDEFLLGDFGDPETGITSPYSYHIQLSPTMSVSKPDMSEGGLRVVDYVLRYINTSLHYTPSTIPTPTQHTSNVHTMSLKTPFCTHILARYILLPLIH